MTTFAAINLKELRQYESFASKEQMDESIYKYIDHIRHEVPQSVIDVLLCLGRASLRCVGLSFMKQSTIAKETGYSRQTINKALKTLEALGVVDSVRTKTNAGRPSVKVIRILPFCLETLQRHLTSTQDDEVNGDNTLTLIDEFEPFEQNHQKQENNNYKENQSLLGKISKLSTNLDLEGDLKNIVRYLALKVGDKIKNDGLEIRAFGSYCGKVLANEMRRFAVKKKIEEEKRQKEESLRRRFEDFVRRYFGESFEDLGQRTQDEAIRMYREEMNPAPVRKVPFYNSLEN